MRTGPSEGVDRTRREEMPGGRAGRSEARRRFSEGGSEKGTPLAPSTSPHSRYQKTSLLGKTDACASPSVSRKMLLDSPCPRSSFETTIDRRLVAERYDACRGSRPIRMGRVRLDRCVGVPHDSCSFNTVHAKTSKHGGLAARYRRRLPPRLPLSM